MKSLFRLINNQLNKKGFEIIQNANKNKKVWELCHKEGCYQLYDECLQIYNIVKSTAKINGDIAEVGVYQAGSARIICEAKLDKKLYLFDTFKGLPYYEKVDEVLKMKLGEMNETSIELVKDKLKEYKNVFVYKGIFPKENSEVIKNKKFSFVFLDVDVYQSTKDCLEFFYPRMNKGGIILTHDYFTIKNEPTGVKKAFDEFFKDKLEIIIKVAGTQAMVVKL